jgi:hypothetical protein
VRASYLTDHAKRRWCCKPSEASVGGLRRRRLFLPECAADTWDLKLNSGCVAFGDASNS